MEVLAERLRAALNKRGLSQRKFAAMLGVEQTTFCAYCNARRTPSVEMLVRISELLDVPTDYLLGRTDNFEGEK